MGEIWEYTAIESHSKFRISTLIGKHTKENAEKHIQSIKAKSDGNIPRLSSDQLPEYLLAIAETYGEYVPAKPPEVKKRGRPKTKPELKIEPQLVYGQVVKERKNGRIIKVYKKLVISNGRFVNENLPPNDKRFSTSFVERNNLTIRSTNSRFARKTLCFSKKIEELKLSQILNDAHYNSCRKHKSLRILRPDGKRKWLRRTPAMAQGIAEHIWTLEELLTFRLPPVRETQLTKS